jgi:hypothetical protein
VTDDWWDRLYTDDAGETPHEAPQRTVRIEHAPAPAPEPPPFEPTIRQAAGDLLPADPKRRRRVQYLAYNGAAAGVGWWLGMGPAITSALAGADTTRNGVWMGAGLILIAAVAELPTAWMRSPHRHRAIRAVGWCFRIPTATATAALLLFTPDAAL